MNSQDQIKRNLDNQLPKNSNSSNNSTQVNCEYAYVVDPDTKMTQRTSLSEFQFEVDAEYINTDEYDMYAEYDDSQRSVRERELQKALEKARNEIDTLQDTRRSHDRKVKALIMQNATLLKNISSIFKTAKSEIERKNNMITQLRDQITKLKQEKTDKPVREYNHFNQSSEPRQYSQYNNHNTSSTQRSHYQSSRNYQEQRDYRDRDYRK